MFFKRLFYGVATILSVKGGSQFEHGVAFEPGRAQEILRGVPELPGVFALRGVQGEPYLTRTANLRRRMARLLAPPEALDAEGRPVLSRRLNLRERVVRVEWTVTGSEFESNLVLYAAAAAEFGYEAARKRLRLHTPFFLRMTLEHAHPRVYVTNRLSKRGIALTYGPFASRAAVERYCDEALNLFKLRRCYEDLVPHPEHPGCAYGEMKKCLAPCQNACSAQEYATEAAAVKTFFDTRGDSMLAAIEREREQASAAMEFEKAATLHAQWQKVKAIAGLAEEIVRPVPELRAVIVQRAAKLEGGHAEEAAIFLLKGGCLVGPERLSTLGVRAVREQTAVGSSLFAQPLMLQAVPLDAAATEVVEDAPEVRAERVLATLEERAKMNDGDLAQKSDHLSLLRRWYYRPEKQRAGEVFFPVADGSWPVRRILRGAARVVIGEPGSMAETQREAAPAAAKEIKMKILHAGREGVERIVPVVEKMPKD